MKLPTCELGDIAAVALGYKSLQNQFFYLSSSVIVRFGLEKDYLRPIYRIRDLTPSRFLQAGRPSLRLFYCRSDEADLRGTGALKYIRSMAKVPAAVKKQAGKVQSIQEALEAQGGEYWYAPKASPHKSHIWLRKAFDSVYAPYLFDKAAVVDQRCNLVRPKDGTDWEVLAAVLSSTLFALAIESSGSASLGAGALEIPTKKLRHVPVVDARALSGSEQKDLVRLAKEAWEKERPVDWRSTDEPGRAVQQLDAWLLKRLATTVTLQRLYADVRETCRSRLRVAQDKEATGKRVVERDVDAVAEGIASTVRTLLEGTHFPEAFYYRGAAVTRMSIEERPAVIVSCHPEMTNAILDVRDSSTGSVVISGTFPRDTAQLIVRAILMGRRSFDVPIDDTIAGAAMTRFLAWFPGIVDKIERGCRSSALGTRFEEQLLARVMDRLKLHPKVGEKELFGKFVVEG